MVMIDLGMPVNQIVTEIKYKISEAEQKRKEGDALGAATLLTEALALTLEINKPDLIAEILGHRIVCWKHEFQNTEDITYLDRMSRDISNGLSLNLNDERKAVFHLRNGDVLTSKKDFKTANKEYGKAYSMVPAGTLAKAEILGHLGVSFIALGEFWLGTVKIEDACLMLRKMKNVELWRRLIIEAELLGGASKMAYKMQRFEDAFYYAKQSLRISRELRDQWGMPQKLNQFYQQIRMGSFLKFILEDVFRFGRTSFPEGIY